jgi:hypothetical protein
MPQNVAQGPAKVTVTPSADDLLEFANEACGTVAS